MEAESRSQEIMFNISMSSNEYHDFVKSVDELYERTTRSRHKEAIKVLEPIVTLKNIMVASRVGM